jgi:predicted nucleotidyltransferase
MSDQDLLVSRLGAVLEGPPGNGVVAAWLFGSHAEGRAHRDSDIDVGVLLSRGVFPDGRDRFEARLRLYSQLQSAVGRAALDVVVLNDVPPGLAARVVTTGRRVYCADHEAEHAFRRDSQLRAADLLPFLRRTAAIKREAIRR